VAVAVLASGFVVGLPVAPVTAVSVDPIDLGLAAPFAILAGGSLGNTATGPTTVVRGDVGVLAPAGAITGFPPGEVRGTLYAQGAAPVVAGFAALDAAYDDAASRPKNWDLAGDLIGAVLAPGVHTNTGAVALSAGTVVLDGGGDSGAVFIFQVGGALAIGADTKVLLTNGTQAKNVFWRVFAAGGIGARSVFAGTLMTGAAIGIGANTSFNGRALAKTGAVTTDSNQMYSNPPSVTIDGGPVVFTDDDTPTISGYTDVESPSSVTILLDNQSTPAAILPLGRWSATSPILSNGTYTVTVTVIDRADNIGTAIQSLTIDTILPVVTITGGPTRLTNNNSPTIAGTTDIAIASPLTLTVAGQTLQTVVQSNGTWNVTTTALTDGAHQVAVSGADEAGNPGSATQTLTVDTTAAAVVISGGPTALTNDSTPTIAGTSNEAGSSVAISVSGEVLAAGVVSGSGTWSATASFHADGAHPVLVSITDLAGNARISNQTLTIDTIAPSVTTAGGSAITTNNATQTLIGTTSAAPGTIVTVTVAGQTMTTLVQTNGSWNVTPTQMAQGMHVVNVAIPDAAGNVGISAQELTVDAAHIGPPAPTLPGAVPPAATFPAGAAPAVVPVGPKRIFDTRPGESTNALRIVAKTMVGGGNVLEVRVAGLAAYVPDSGAGAVSLNVTVTGSTAAGFVTVYSCGARELVSSVNFDAGQTVANAVIVPISSSGTVCFFSSTPTHVIADINGWFPTGEAFTPVGPLRVFDTRPGQSPDALRTVPTHPIAAEGMLEVALTDLAGYVPGAAVDSVSLNVTVTSPVAAGYLTVYACGTRELVSSVNYVAGQTVANAVIAQVSPTGTVCFYSLASTDLIVDINGWFAEASGFNGTTPKRVLDTRPGESPNALRQVAKIPVGGNDVLEVRVTDLAAVVPNSGVGAVSLNVTATNTFAEGFVTVYSCATREHVSSLNYRGGQTVANAVIAPLSPIGTICLYSSSPVDLIVDINGWFAA
jgi:hypothetical protein